MTANSGVLAGVKASAREGNIYLAGTVSAALVAAASATRDRLIVVEDHYPEGGIGEAVLESLKDAGHPANVVLLAVHDLPGSGTPAELMAAAGISASHIAQQARRLVGA